MSRTTIMETQLDALLEEKSEANQEGQAEDQKSAEKEEQEPTLKEIAAQVKELAQWGKGFSATRAELNEIKARLNEKREQSDENGDQYVTQSSLREIITDVLNNRDQAAEQFRVEANNVLDEQFNELAMNGLVKPSDKTDFFDYAWNVLGEGKEVVPLHIAARSWKAYKTAQGNAKSEAEKERAKEKQEQGSKVGSSSNSSKQNRIKMDEIHRLSFDDIL